ncbi:MAG TPA: hypothetical protein PKA53_13850 [Sphingobacterium sp.]|nr:hypothetical protein [Sphingobacterium sp.]
MATKDENKLVGNEMHKKKKVRLGKDGKELVDVATKHEGDGEAGVDPQTEQLNDMPNDPTDRPLEPASRRKSPHS